MSEDESTAGQDKKNKKINRMNLDEVTAKIAETEEKMGGLTSRYAFRLLRRKSQLEG